MADATPVTTDDLNDYDRSLVRKWGTKILAVGPTSIPVPTAFFDSVTHKPFAFPDGMFGLGFVTTDGIKENVSIKTDDTNMDQTLSPVRKDITGKDKTLQVTFGEVSAWTQALRAGIPLEQWPADKTGAFAIDEGDVAEMPHMRLYLIAVDGEGDDAHYRVEYALDAQVSDIGDRTLSRSTEEHFETTFALFQDSDDSKRRSYIIRQDGPGYSTHLTEA